MDKKDQEIFRGKVAEQVLHPREWPETDTKALHKALSLLAPSFFKMSLTVSQANEVIDKMNDCLSNTPLMFLMTADGVVVFLRTQAASTAKQLFNTDTLKEVGT